MGYQPLKPETQELYLKIWTHYAVGNFNQEQLAKLFVCSQDTITNAICWCARHKMQFTSPVLIEAAKEAVEARLRELSNDIIKIKEKEPVNWNATIGIYRIIKENQELLWSMQGIIQKENPFIVNTFGINQKFDYKVMESLEETREENRKVRSVIDGWTAEQKQAFLLVTGATESGAKITINESDNITTIQLSKDLNKEGVI